jgi:hypothetical protein
MNCTVWAAVGVFVLSCILIFSISTFTPYGTRWGLFGHSPEDQEEPCSVQLPLTALMYSCPPFDTAPVCNSSSSQPDAESTGCGGVSNGDLAAFVEDLPVRDSAPLVASFLVLAWPGGITGEVGAVPQCWELGARHTLMIQALDAAGDAVGVGGEFLEAQLKGPELAYRPRVLDLGDGRYTVEVHLPADELLSGQKVQLRVLRLWRRWGGLTVEEYKDEAVEIVAIDESFLLLVMSEDISGAMGCPANGAKALRRPGEVLLPPPSQECRDVDFTDTLAWHGHWLRVPNGVGAKCPHGACSGDPSRLLTPWVYRLGSGVTGPHRSEGCFFHLFHPQEARTCVNGSWWHMNSDSQGRDFADTLLLDVLDVDMTGWHISDNPNQRIGFRFFDLGGWRNPPAYPPGVFPKAEFNNWPASPAGADAFLFRISNDFIGHYDPFKDYYGMRTLTNPVWRATHVQWLRDQLPRVPDVFLASAATHDAIRCDDVSNRDLCFGPSGHSVISDFLSDLEGAVEVWHEMSAVFESSLLRSNCTPRWIWRGASAPGGHWRKFKANPQKLEVFDRLTQARLTNDKGAPGLPCPAPNRRWSFSGFFDMTWDDHFLGADRGGGPHYGSSNVEANCDGAKCRHVEIMHVHALLNTLCPRPQN